MKRIYKVVLGLLAVLIIAAVCLQYFDRHGLAVLSSQGQIADEQRKLIIFSALLSLIVVIPVFVMTILFAWRYRENNQQANYSPDWDHDNKIEAVWWLVPTILIVILSVITWQSTHRLDPFQPLTSDVKPLRVQAVALQWKWLFIYPEEEIASVNYLSIPVNRPINMEITADAPMNSFWVPELAGQIYAMNGMSTKLHLIANQVGNYPGRSANISGRGFAGMQFTVAAESSEDFQQWLSLAKSSNLHLNEKTYRQLAQPSQSSPVTVYSTVQSMLYDRIVQSTAPQTKPELGL